MQPQDGGCVRSVEGLSHEWRLSMRAKAAMDLMRGVEAFGTKAEFTNDIKNCQMCKSSHVVYYKFTQLLQFLNTLKISYLDLIDSLIKTLKNLKYQYFKYNTLNKYLMTKWPHRESSSITYSPKTWRKVVHYLNLLKLASKATTTKRWLIKTFGFRWRHWGGDYLTLFSYV